MERPVTDRATTSWTPASAALGGVVLAILGGLLLAQAGGSDREMFISLGLALEAIGLLGIVIGGVAIGVRMGRE